MQAWAWPLSFALLTWWLGTGAILVLDGLHRRTFSRTMAGATVLCVLALAGLAASSGRTSVAAAYCAFTCAMVVWAWQEVAFLLGWVTGPRRTPCPPGLSGMPRARAALQTVLHHEAALIVLGAAVLSATWGQPNQTGLWTFAVLWAMRQSAKLNVFLGVRNLSENFLPAHLRYLQSYFSRRAMNPLLPVSVVGASVVAVLVWQAALDESASDFRAASLGLVGAMLGLAILEHCFMVLPVPLDGLWRWSLKGQRARDREV